MLLILGFELQLFFSQTSSNYSHLYEWFESNVSYSFYVFYYGSIHMGTNVNHMGLVFFFSFDNLTREKLLQGVNHFFFLSISNFMFVYFSDRSLINDSYSLFFSFVTFLLNDTHEY